MQELQTLALLAIPAAFMAWTIVCEEIFRDLRDLCEKRSDHPNPIIRKLCYLPTCYYCTGTWTAFFVLVLHPVRFVSDGPQGLLLAWFTLVAIEQVYLNAFHLIRVWLRASRAMADFHEVIRDNSHRYKEI